MDANQSPAQSADGAKAYRALIFGWWGSTVRNLNRYERLHRDLGATAIEMVPCKSMDMSKNAKLPRIAQQAAKACLESPGGARLPIVIHVFSNGGMVQYLNFFKNHPELRSDVAAAIFDSTPGYLDLNTFIGALSANIPALRMIKPAFSALSAVGAVLLVRLWRRNRNRAYRVVAVMAALVALHMRSTRRTNHVYFQRCLKDPCAVPSLYLFSSVDKLVDYRVVERLAHERRLEHSIAPKPLVLRWDDSPHVAHAKAHPVEYKAAMEDLLRSVLR